MTLLSILTLAIGLAMDAAAVSAARGLATPHILPRHVFAVALWFGGFQALMPAVGYWVGASVGPAVEAWDHWIAFVVLGALGAKMLWEAQHEGEEAVDRSSNLYDWHVMFALAVATSIDALAAGVTLPMLHAPLLLSLSTIGITTAVLSAAGLFAGRYFGAALGKRLDMAGGFALIGLGTKVLVEHLTA